MLLKQIFTAVRREKMFIKTGMFENELGRLQFEKTGPLYMSKIDASGVDVDSDDQDLVGLPGSVAGELRLRARVIPAEFQFADIRTVIDRDRIAAVFDPLLWGTLTVFTENDEYKIDCRPQESPVYVRDKDVDYLWTFSINFYAPFPYWKRAKQRVFTPSESGTFTIMSKTAKRTPVEITYQPGASGMLALNGASMTINNTHSKAITINTKDLTVIDSDGNSVYDVINIATYAIEDIVMNYGENTLVVAGGDPVIRWYELARSFF
jgi:hypothetical protein